MINELEFSPKQVEYIKQPKKRWNAKVGAVRSGKTHLDYVYSIPTAIMERRGKKGLYFLIGVSRDTIERNILEPMRDFWGKNLVGFINSRNKVKIFNEVVECLGGEKSNQVSKLQGSEIKYAYVDEATNINEDVWQMLKSRLSLPYSICEFACNPKEPTHWMKKFLDGVREQDLYLQKYTIFDNPFLDKDYVSSLCSEYEGTVYYDRYILGEWRHAEGIIYRKFADNPNAYILKEVPDDVIFLSSGIDFGGNESAHTFVTIGITRGYKSIVVLESERIEEKVNPEQLDDKFEDYCVKIWSKYGMVSKMRYDNAEPVLARGLKSRIIRSGLRVQLLPARKNKVDLRIQFLIRLIAQGRFFVMENCKTVIRAISEAIWDGEERADDGTSDIDTMDALEYAFEEYMNNFIDVRGV